MLTPALQLKLFYKDYLTWVDNEAPVGRPFSRHLGLCAAMETWCKLNKVNLNPVRERFNRDIELCGLCGSYPFGGMGLYLDLTAVGAQHQNPIRLQWCREYSKLTLLEWIKIRLL